ncbi:prepilin-type N-terminal cleavage/methylation domain-containing protein [Stutzerimonas nitrititolerans]|uniref:prepilin-type N-terminal cleavage/methylation domain-containing protein n=1 Tax=Stutzerimonas nitrititolerans TaxID=2482751 RepID=UPI0028AA011C|nr:prepilin-type N-terminal cleavage/methylation domain-containing protein [Stutzerimonas nitrititolerans]
MSPLAAPRQPSHHPARATPRKQHGMTLVELVITIVIIGIAAAALFSAMATITARSADPMLRQQSLYIAEAYMEEILAKAFFDPVTRDQCPSPPGARKDFDNVCDFDGWSDVGGALDINNQPISGLSGYDVNVTVKPAELNEVGSDRALLITVEVRDPAGQSLALSGWRTCYGEYDETRKDLCRP